MPNTKTPAPSPATRPATSPDDKVADPTPHAPGQTTPSTSDGLAPRLPHERDESADSQTSAPRPVIEQARRDVEGGLVDTDRGPVTDALYERSARRDGTPKSPPRGKP